MNGDYVANMEQVLDLYGAECPENTARLCFDERPCQLIEDVYIPIKMKEGKVKKIDCEYKRNGTASLLMVYDIDQGLRYGEIHDRRTKKEFSEFMDRLEVRYDHVDKLIIVLDNLNTHKYGSFYEFLQLDRAAALRKKIEFVYTPKHGSWLNMIEIEFAALSKQCLNRRIPSKERLDKEFQSWQEKRNEKKVKISWSFTVPKARDKMASHYIKVCNAI